MQPIVGITAGELLNYVEVWAPKVYGQSYTYVDAVNRAGASPFIIPFLNDETALRRLYDMTDAIVFSGGNDVDPSNYGAEPSGIIGDTSPRRDKQEMLLMKWAHEDNKPILAICRGMQLLNVYRGGTLYQDIPTELPDASNHTMSDMKADFFHVAHRLKIDPKSKIAAILGVEELDANTLHHQAVKDLGEGLKATAWSEDGVVEAIEDPARDFIVGVQSHPEVLEDEVEKTWRNLFNHFVASAKKTN